jgi:hypothetical protein
MSSDASNQNDPVARATTVAAKLNQLSLENVDAVRSLSVGMATRAAMSLK